MADVITVTTGNVGATGSIAAALINQLQQKFLDVAKFNVGALDSLLQQDPITHAKTKQWNRLEKNAVPTVPSQLEEGVTPPSLGISINKITAILEQYGDKRIISELAEFTASNPVVQGAMETEAIHMAETRHQLIYTVLDAATNTYRIAGRANDNAIQVGDTLSYEEMTKIRKSIVEDGVPRFANGNLRAVIPTATYTSLLNDADWKENNKYDRPEALRTGYVGTLGNIDIMESDSDDFVATASTTGGNSNAIHTGFVCGRGWAAVTSLDSADKKLYMKAPGYGDDLLEQRFQIGWKLTFKSVILNQTFGLRFRASAHDAGAV